MNILNKNLAMSTWTLFRLSVLFIYMLKASTLLAFFNKSGKMLQFRDTFRSMMHCSYGRYGEMSKIC